MAQFRGVGLPGMTPVVKNLIIINVIVFAAQYLLERSGIPVEDLFALHYVRSEHFHSWQLITHMFMHANIQHILFNMFALYMFGIIIENILGPQRFLIFYLTCGIGAAICQLVFFGIEWEPVYKAFQVYQNNATLDQYDLFLKTRIPQTGNSWAGPLYNIRQDWMNNPQGANFPNESISYINKYLFGGVVDGTLYPGLFDEPMLGASGAIMGVLFAFGYLLPNAMLYMFFFLPLKAKYAIAIFAAIDIFGGFQNTDNVAHFAHLGGMLFGFIMLRIWRIKSSNRIY